MREDMIQVEGTVVEVCPSTMFKVDIGVKDPITCHISGKLRQNYIRISRGDKVSVALSPYDLSKGRIIWRNR